MGTATEEADGQLLLVGDRIEAQAYLEEVVRREFGLYQEAEITPAVNFSSLDEVLILTEGSREHSLSERGDGEAREASEEP